MTPSEHNAAEPMTVKAMTTYDKALYWFDHEPHFRSDAMFFLRGHEKDSRMVDLLNQVNFSEAELVAILAHVVFDRSMELPASSCLKPVDWLGRVPSAWLKEVEVLWSYWFHVEQPA
jgi:hypothetical protein